MSLIKNIVETTSRCYGFDAIVIEQSDIVIVSRRDYWPVSIVISQLTKQPCDNDKIIDRLAKKLKQSGIMKK